MKECPVCDKEILPEDKKYLFGNDKPYFNVYLHRTCWETKPNMLELIPKMFEIYRRWSKKGRT